jgi:hypothetical protein
MFSITKGISHCGDSIEGKLVTADDELNAPDCGNATNKTEKDAEVEMMMMMKADKHSPRVQSNLTKILLMIKLMIMRLRSVPGSWEN